MWNIFGIIYIWDYNDKVMNKWKLKFSKRFFLFLVEGERSLLASRTIFSSLYSIQLDYRIFFLQLWNRLIWWYSFDKSAEIIAWRYRCIILQMIWVDQYISVACVFYCMCICDLIWFYILWFLIHTCAYFYEFYCIKFIEINQLDLYFFT